MRAAVCQQSANTCPPHPLWMGGSRHVEALKKIVQLEIDRGQSQAEIGKKLGRTQPWVSQLLAGDRQDIEVDVAVRARKHYGVDLLATRLDRDDDPRVLSPYPEVEAYIARMIEIDAITLPQIDHLRSQRNSDGAASATWADASMWHRNYVERQAQPPPTPSPSPSPRLDSKRLRKLPR